jgi:hypothetical protein
VRIPWGFAPFNHWFWVPQIQVPDTSQEEGSRMPTIDYTIESENFENALYELGASVSVMPKKVFDKIN